MQIASCCCSRCEIPISHNSNYWFQTKSIAYSVKMSSFNTLHSALPWPRCACATKASRHHNLGAFELQTLAFRHNSLPYHQKLVQLATYLLRFVYTVCLLRFESRLDFITIALHDPLLTFSDWIRQKVQYTT